MKLLASRPVVGEDVAASRVVEEAAVAAQIVVVERVEVGEVV